MSRESSLGCLSIPFAIVGLGIVFGAMAYSAKAVHYVLDSLGIETPLLGGVLTFGLWIGGFYLLYRLVKPKDE